MSSLQKAASSHRACLRDLLLSLAVNCMETSGGKLQVRWNEGAAVTPFGQMAFFNGFLNLTGVLELSSTSMRSAAGTLGNPGMVMMLPQMTTTNSAPWAGRTLRIGRMWPEGAPLRLGSAEKDDCVFVMQTGK